MIFTKPTLSEKKNRDAKNPTKRLTFHMKSRNCSAEIQVDSDVTPTFRACDGSMSKVLDPLLACFELAPFVCVWPRWPASERPRSSHPRPLHPALSQTELPAPEFLGCILGLEMCNVCSHMASECFRACMVCASKSVAFVLDGQLDLAALGLTPAQQREVRERWIPNCITFGCTRVCVS